jgi:DeoR/GlpR family transcriptional regulator of sugar metabolism
MSKPSNISFLKQSTRQVEIIRQVQGGGAIGLNELAGKLGISGSTLRRDLRPLEEAGVLSLTAGKVEESRTAGVEMPYTLRMLANREEKQRIARAALELIHNGETVFISGGTTAVALASLLAGQRRLTAITNSLRVANLLLDQPGIELVIVGGRVRSGEQTLHGHLTEWGAQQLRADKLFFGIQAITPQHGLTHAHLVEVSSDRALAESAAQVIVLADHTKFGRVAPAFVLPLSKVNLIITGVETAPEYIEALRAQNVQVLVV